MVRCFLKKDPQLSLCEEELSNMTERPLGVTILGRPNAEDLKHAEEFAQNLKQTILGFPV